MSDVAVPKHDMMCPCGEEAIGLAVPLRGVSDPSIEEVLWKPTCVRCADSVMSYVVDYDRMRTVEQALDWTLHLSEKTWYPKTDWPSVMYRTWNVGGNF